MFGGLQRVQLRSRSLIEQYGTLGQVSSAGSLVPNEPDDADHRQDHAQGCDSNCPKSVLPIAVALHRGTSPAIIGLGCACLLGNSVEFHVDGERNFTCCLSAVCDAPV